MNGFIFAVTLPEKEIGDCMKTVKRYWIYIILIISLVFSACTLNNSEGQPVEDNSDIIDDNNQNSYIANPWTEVTKEDVEKGLGTEIVLPHDAKNVIFRFNSSIELYEILFDYDVLSFTYRIKKSAETEDISGLYYDWTNSYEETVEGYEAKIYRALTEDDAIELITWFDSKEDISYSLSTFVGDLDGFHIEDVVKQLINKDSEDLSTEENLFDVETIRDYLAKKYTCDTPPFYTVLDHISEDGLFVYHIYESVDNEVEVHSATIDWVTVNPKTGEATTFFGETFFIDEADIE